VKGGLHQWLCGPTIFTPTIGVDPLSWTLVLPGFC
jgi:hypothetical protein